MGLDKTDLAIAQLGKAKEGMTANMAQLLERDQKLDNMLQKTESMSSLSQSLLSKSVKVRKKMWWQSKFLFIVGVVLIVVTACSLRD